MNHVKRAVAALLVIGALSACAPLPSKAPEPDAIPSDYTPPHPPDPAASTSGSPRDAAAPPVRPAWVTPVTDDNFTDLVDRHHPNELGRVLILEYHHFGAVEERWTRRWDHFRHDLEVLYAGGYRAVNLLDYLADRMPLPAGTSPVIFTFDDSVLSQFKLNGDEADPQSAVGIMLAFQREHPDFGLAGTFYVNFTSVPFRETDNWQQKVRFLVDHGFEVANHTLHHDDLGSLTDAKVQETLAKQVAQLRSVMPEYDGSTLALPFGIWPQDKALAVDGEAGGIRYHHRAVLLVGSDPVYSPYDKRLDVLALPRVQAIDSEFERWMPYLKDARYISDGDPDSVVFPESVAEFLRPEAVNGKAVRTYSDHK